MTFQNILVPLDGSRLSEDILPDVELVASHMRSSVTLLHVLERDAPPRIHGEPHLTDSASAHDYLTGLGKHLESAGLKVGVHVHSRPVGDVAAAIDAHAHEFDIGLIAMCKHGRSGIRRMLVGGIAQEILQGGGTPLLLRTPHHGSARLRLRNILVPLDLQHSPDPAISVASELSRVFQARIHLITVVSSLATSRGDSATARLLPTATEATLRMQEQDAAATLARHEAELAARNIPADVMIRSGDAASAILEAAETLPADLIVLMTHARAGFEAWYTGSTGQRVIAGARATLLLLREL